MNGRERRETVFTLTHRSMMEGDGFHDRHGQTPQPKEVGSYIGMGRAKHELFSFDEAKLSFPGKGYRFLILLSHVGSEHEFAHIMEQTGDKSFVHHGAIGALSLGNFFGEGPDGQAMVPNFVE